MSPSKLPPSPASVRRTGAGSGIEALTASFQAHGLLQSLVVRARPGSDRRPTGRYEVVAGARRRAKRKRVSKGIAIPCRVRSRPPRADARDQADRARRRGWFRLARSGCGAAQADRGDRRTGCGDRARIADELGDMLFVLGNLARKLGQDPEACLQGASNKLTRRFNAMERLAADRGATLGQTA